MRRFYLTMLTMLIQQVKQLIRMIRVPQTQMVTIRKMTFPRTLIQIQIQRTTTLIQQQTMVIPKTMRI